MQVDNGLNIQTIQSKDFNFVLRMFHQRSSFFALTELLEVSISEMRSLFQAGEGKINESFYIIRNASTHPIAIISLSDLNLSARGAFLRLAWDGRKNRMGILMALREICKYLFLEENFSKIIVQVLNSEKKLQKLLEKARFTLEVRLREAFYDFGRYEDVLTYGILRENF